MNWLRASLAVAVCGASASAADWPQWLGPKRDGGSAEVVEPWSAPPKEVWRVKAGAGFSSPVVAGGKVFVHSRVPKKEREEVVAYDAGTGKEVWRTAYDRAPYSSVLNTGPQATPTVAGGRVYTFGITGVLACFDADSGKIVWQTEALKKLGANVPRFGVCCSPLVVGNRVLVAVGGKGSAVVAFDTETGEVAWQALDDSASTSSPVLFAAKGRPVPDVVFMTTLRVVGLNPLDGSVVWDFPLPFQPGGTAPTPIVSGDRVFTSTMTNGTTAVRLSADSSSPASKAWQEAKLSGYFSTGVATTDRLYVITNTLKPVPRADLACVNVATGKLVWKKENVGYFHFGLIRTGDGKLLTLDDGGTLRLLADDESQFRELAKAKVCGGNLVTPALSDGKLYVRDDDGVACIALK